MAYLPFKLSRWIMFVSSFVTIVIQHYELSILSLLMRSPALSGTAGALRAFALRLKLKSPHCLRKICAVILAPRWKQCPLCDTTQHMNTPMLYEITFMQRSRLARLMTRHDMN